MNKYESFRLKLDEYCANIDMQFGKVAVRSNGKVNKYAVIDAGVAQLVVQLIRNQQVTCSSHATSSKKRVLQNYFNNWRQYSLAI